MGINKHIIFDNLPFNLKICQNSVTKDPFNYQIQRGDYYLTMNSDENLLTWTYEKSGVTITRTMFISDENANINLTKSGIVLILQDRKLTSYEFNLEHNIIMTNLIYVEIRYFLTNDNYIILVKDDDRVMYMTDVIKIFDHDMNQIFYFDQYIIRNFGLTYLTENDEIIWYNNDSRYYLTNIQKYKIVNEGETTESRGLRCNTNSVVRKVLLESDILVNEQLPSLDGVILSPSSITNEKNTTIISCRDLSDNRYIHIILKNGFLSMFIETSRYRLRLKDKYMLLYNDKIAKLYELDELGHAKFIKRVETNIPAIISTYLDIIDDDIKSNVCDVVSTVVGTEADLSDIILDYF